MSNDGLAYDGMAQEVRKYREETGNYTFWSGSMFSGMPTFQIGGGKIASVEYIQPLKKTIHGGLADTMFLLFGYLIGFFILLKAFKINTWLSIAGAMAITLSSYFFIIIEAGHYTKAETIGMMAAVIGGFRLIYDRKYLAGATITAVCSAVSVLRHPQMSYYIFLLIGMLFLAELYTHIKAKEWKAFGIGTAIFAAAIFVGIGSNYTNFRINQDYVKETMRGGHSELTKETDSENKTEGLDLDYATAWSYGISETMTLLIPNFMGASSQYNTGKNSIIYKTLTANGVPARNAEELCRTMPMYWGTQPFTSGPVYVGAIVVFLFILGLFLVQGPYKWALLAATLFSILLAWGRNFMPLTELFFNYFPMYNKFRAVASALVVAEITMPLLGFLAVKNILDKKFATKEIWGSVKKSAAITTGICLFFALFGSVLFDFHSPSDARAFVQFPEWLTDAVLAERASMLRTDAFRSALFILIAAGTLWLFVRGKIKSLPFIGILGIVILADMWTVDKRFLNDANFQTVRNKDEYFRKQPYEEYILQDTDPHFRVLNLATDTYNDSRTSYYLKSIGGYHAAKLRRYQDLIDSHLSKFNWKVINMLNTKYVITPDKTQGVIPQRNEEALGNAWFVDSIRIVGTPNEESDALYHMDLTKIAVTDSAFFDFVKDFVPGADTTARIRLTHYAPDVLAYESNSEKAGIAVFSEIYYPYGWNASIDGMPATHFRVNYLLRALRIPAGKHTVRFEFRPEISRYEQVSFASIAVIYLLLAGWLVSGLMYLCRNTADKAEETPKS